MHRHPSYVILLILLTTLLGACAGGPTETSEPTTATSGASPSAPLSDQPTAGAAANEKSLVGSVTDTSGDPVAGAEIVVISGGSETVAATSDADGQFTLSLPLGTYTFEARSAGYTPYRESDVDIAMIDLLLMELAPGSASGTSGQPQSYRLAYTLSYDATVSGGPFQGTIVLERRVATADRQFAETTDWQSDPLGDVELTTRLGSYQIGDQFYTVTTQSGQEYCSTSSEANPLLQTFKPDQIVFDITEYGPALGEETVNGVAATRHRVERSEPGKGTVAADVWLAKDGGYLVKHVGSARYDEPVIRGDLSLGIIPFSIERGTFTWSYELSEVNAAVSVAKPAACEQMQGVGGLALPASASGVSNGEFFTSFTSSESADALEAFYRGELEAQGWQATSAAAPDVAGHDITATKGADTISILISGRDSGSSVLITRR